MQARESMRPGAKIGFFQLKEKQGHNWLCVCGCGREFTADASNIAPTPTTGKPRQRSCGCMKRCPRPHTRIYSDEELIARAKKYKARGVLAQQNRTLYSRLYRRGLLDSAFPTLH